MTSKWMVRIAFAVLAILAASPVIAAEADGAPELFGAPTAMQKNLVAVQPGDSVVAQVAVNEENISVNTEALLAKNGVTQITLDGIAHTAIRTQPLEGLGRLEGFVWKGRIDNSPFLSFAVVHGASVFGQFYLSDGTRYDVRSRFGATYVAQVSLASITQAKSSHGTGSDAITLTKPLPAIDTLQKQMLEKALSADDPNPSVLVLVDHQAAQAIGSQSDVEAFVQAHVITDVNAVLANIGYTTLHVRLAATLLWNYDDTGSYGTDLTYVATNKSIAQTRSNYGADLVTLLVETGGAIAYRPTAQSTFAPSAGFSVIERSGTQYFHTAFHELCHNFGCDHDPANAIVPASQDPNPFARAWVDPNGKNGDILSYVCQAGCTIQPFTSTLKKTWNGQTIGIANQEDNESMIEKGMPLVAGYLHDPSCVPSDTTLCLQNGRFQVQATWEDFSHNTGPAHVMGGGTVEFSNLWFFSPTNAEILIKVLDGRGLNNAFWVFAAGLTNVKVVLTVTDTVTGKTHTYVNNLNQAFLPIQDTGTFTDVQ